MKILIYTLALISAFFVFNVHSSIPDSYDPTPVPAEVKYTSNFECVTGNTVVASTSTQAYIDEAPHSSCIQPVIDHGKQQLVDNSNFCSFHSDIINEQQRTVTIQYEAKNWGSCSSPNLKSSTFNYGARSVGQPEESTECPPENYPEYKIASEDSSGQAVCYRLKADIPEPDPNPEPDPDPDDNSCNEFGDNSFLPPQSGLNVPAGGSVCYTTSTGKQCKYSASDFGDGYNQTGQTCSGEEPDYGQPQTPPDEGCATVGSLEFFALCPIDPNEVCNQIIVDGYTQQQCPKGCGSINGEYVCTYPDENANGIPDKDENPDNPDNPDPDNPDSNNPDPVDMSETNNLLSGLGSKLDGVGSKIDGVGSKIDGLGSKLDDVKSGIDSSNESLSSIDSKLSDLGSKQDISNQHLGNITSNTGSISENTGITAGNTGDILEAITDVDTADTFNPDSSASFYESSYENGFDGVWSEKSEAFKQTETFLFLEQFKFNSSGKEPDTDICFNLGAQMNFGCAELPIATPQLLAILKVFILITAAFLCRALIFGG
ncbi:hypothetical protein N9V89_00740 [Pseudoalteromonas sp.]|nr:hypothetical protein [Pseudoalteromonas sp.]